MNCHLSDLPRDLPDAGEGVCCAGAAMYGPLRCTCWTAVYDLEQVDPDPTVVRLLAAGIEPSTQARMCADCAYRPDSPERRGEPEALERIAAEDRFWCHQGMRRPHLWRHPAGVEVPGHPAAYRPPVVAGVPFQASGQPGLLCAGWAARRRALTAKDAITEVGAA